MSVTASNVTDSSERLSFLVLDANAFIRGHGLDLFHKAERLVTTQEVLNEVRDAKAQELLSRLPFTLEVLSPSAEACREVAAFATKTGDFRQLSKTDLRLIALTYSLYTQVHGEPPKRRKTLADLSKAQTHSQTHSQTQKKSSGAVSVSVTVSESSTVSHTDTHTDTQTTTTDVITTVIATEESESESESDNEDNNDEPAAEAEPVNENNTNDDNNNDNNNDDEVDAVAESLADISLFPSLSANANTNADNNSTAAAAEEKKEKKPFSWADVAKRPQTVSNNSSAAAARASKLPVRESVIAAHVPQKTETAEHAQTETKKNDEAVKTTKVHRARTAEHTQSVQKENESRAMALEDDQTGWINTENLHAVNTFDVFAKDSKKGKESKKEKKEKKSVEESKKVRVACFTTDFSMQNVLLQLGLKVLASDGMFVRSARQWVLRCVGCHTVHTRDLNRLFCSQCGLSQLSRIAASVDARTGTLRLHLKANYRIDTRGTKFSLPAPGKQNRFDGELLLREDQLLTGIWRQKTVKYNKNVQSAFGESVTEEVGLQLNKLERDVVVGWGTGNPNARRGRERRGKKHTKH